MFNSLWPAAKIWYKRDPFTHSAAIAYYTIFSFPALMIVITAIAGIIFDQHTVHTQIVSYLKTILGKQAAQNLFTAVEHTSIKNDNILFFVAGLVALLFTAIRLFMQLQIALNNIWGINKKQKSWYMFLLRRAESFGVMVSVGFMLLVSLLITTGLAALNEWLSAVIDDSVHVVIQALNFCISYITITFMFTAIIKILPDFPVRWRSAFKGSLFAGLLFMIGEYALGSYFGFAKPASAYGITGSIILLMLWVSYSCLILLYGAELAKIFNEGLPEAPAARHKPKRKVARRK